MVTRSVSAGEPAGCCVRGVVESAGFDRWLTSSGYVGHGTELRLVRWWSHGSACRVVGIDRRHGGDARGTTLSIAELFDDEAAGLLAWFQSRTYSAEVAADLCAETFAVAIEHQDRFDPGRGAAGAWLWGIGRNLLGQYVRSASVEQRAVRRLAIQVPLVSDDDLDGLTDRLDAQRLGALLADQLDALGPNVAAAVRARVLEAQPYAAVAARCGCSEGAARVRVARGLAALLDGLDDITESGVTA